MKVLKTIVATAVIVFALTTVAMAGVQHFTKQSAQATGSQARTAQPSYTVTLTAAQLAQLMNGGRAATADGAQHARQTRQHARQTRQHAKTARHQTRSHASDRTRASASGSSGTHHYEATQHAGFSTSSAGSHHAETGHHSGGGEGGSCRD